MIVYNELKDRYEDEGYTPFVTIVKWTPEQRPAAIKTFSQVFSTPEGQGVKGLHAWNLIGRNTMILIGWTNSAVSLQKFCAAITFGTGLLMEIFPAIDQFGLQKALREVGSLQSAAGKPKSRAKKTPEAEG